MGLLDDPSMKEIVDGFCDESIELLDELESTLEEMEDEPTKVENLEKFGQVIDRIMGAANTVGATEVGKFAELGKAIGYKASQTTDPALLEVVVAILFDCQHLTRLMVTKIKTGEDAGLSSLNTDAFVTRLKWLQDKFRNIERSSCVVDEKDTKELDQSSIDDLMASLGL